MRIVNLPVRVETAAAQPLAVWWGYRRKVVAVLDSWSSSGRWWQGELPREHYRLLLFREVTVEIYQQGEEWYLLRVAD
jgi:hypothetical protein